MSSLSSDMVSEITDEDECKCAANEFYKTYKTQINAELSHYFMNQKFMEQKKNTSEGLQNQKRSDMKIAKEFSTQKFKKKVKPNYSKQEQELLNVDEPKKVSSSSLVKQGKKKQGKSDSELSKDLKDDEGKDKDKDRDKEKKEVGFHEKVSAEVFSEKIKSDVKSTKGEGSEDKIKSFASFKGEEDTGAAYLKEPQPEHVDFFVSALNAKLHEVLDESVEEEYTERGYFQFDRFREPSEPSGAAYKVSTLSTRSVEDEGTFQYILPKLEEQYTSESMRQALDYLKNHKIEDLFKFLGAHLVAANPCDPIDFLINLLESCLNYRMGYREPPLLYTPKHIESLYYSMDPMKIGAIEMHQYHAGMFTLGIRNYNLFPSTVSNNRVTKQVFMNEAVKQLRIQLNDLIHSFDESPSVISGQHPISSVAAHEG